MNTKYFADIEYSKKLKDEFPKAEWWWVPAYMSSDPEEIPQWVLVNTEIMKKSDELEVYPAIHTDLVLEILPEYIKKDVLYYLEIHKSGGWNFVRYMSIKRYKLGMPNDGAFRDKSLPNCLCKMLIWLRNEGKNG